MMSAEKFEKYFLDKDIHVSFNVLGRTEELVKAYIYDTQDIVDDVPSKMSHHVKHACYSKFYSIENRKKFTGFEEF